MPNTNDIGLVLESDRNKANGFLGLGNDTKADYAMIQPKPYATVVKNGSQYVGVDYSQITDWTVKLDSHNLWSAVDDAFKIPAGVSKVKVNACISKADNNSCFIMLSHAKAAENYAEYNLQYSECLYVGNISSGVFSVAEGDLILLRISLTGFDIDILSSTENELLPFFSLEVVE